MAVKTVRSEEIKQSCRLLCDQALDMTYDTLEEHPDYLQIVRRSRDGVSGVFLRCALSSDESGMVLRFTWKEKRTGQT